MTQSAEHVLDHFELFRGPEYQQMLANKKKMFENPRDPAEVERIREWAKTPEYREKNFAREALTVNPAKACQPLGRELDEDLLRTGHPTQLIVYSDWAT